MKRLRLLTPNCHEAWIFQLRHLDADVDILDGLPGRDVAGWDLRQRPVPPNGKLIFNIPEAGDYDCILAHNISDLLLLRDINVPKLLVLHTSLEHRVLQEKSRIEPARFAAAVREYLQNEGIHAAAGTELKAKSWNLTKDVLGLAVDGSLTNRWSGEIETGLRVANQITQKRETLYYEFHEKAFHNIPICILGRNPEIAGARPSESYEDLLKQYQSRRFFVHTAKMPFEDGYNMASVEAMAAGMPVVGNEHPTSPVEHNKSGFLAKTPEQAAEFANVLLRDRDRAAEMGSAARESILQLHPVDRFVTNLVCAMEKAKNLWVAKRGAAKASF